MTTTDDIPIMRVPISLPCMVPVVPGTPDSTAPIEQRTERCAVDAWWMIGRAMICDLHLRSVLGDDYGPTVAQWPDLVLNQRETVPWEQMHRYDQASAQPDWRGQDG